MADQGTGAVDDPSFPIHWPEPGDEHLRWDLRGSDRQVRPLLADLERLEFGAFARRNAVHGGPREERRFEQFNGYLYEHAEGPDPEAMKAWRQNPPPSFVAGAGNPLAAWREHLLPPVRRAVERLEAANLESLSWPELQRHLEDALTLDEQVELTIGAIDWAHDLPGRFLDLDRTLFGEAHLPVALDLLRGIDCLLLQMVRDLQELRCLACELPQVKRALQEATPEALRLLDRTATGRMFQRALSGFLDRHGRRFAFRDLWEPSWREDPAPVLTLLRGDPPRPGRDPQAADAEQNRMRDEAEAAVRLQCASVAPEERAKYWERLRVAREAMIVHEDCDVWMQQRCRAALRDVLLACAGRLTRTARIEQAEDLWWLRLDELLCAPYPITDWGRIVAGRKAEWARWSAVTPPRQLGAVHVAVEAAQPASPREEAGPTQPRALRGTAASRGTVRGRARLVKGWADIPRVQAGDIVVAPWLSPSLTLVLSRAAAVVTAWGAPPDRTGMVARQLDIPAVLGCRGAERLVEDGQTITVDGTTGSVRLMP